MQLDLGARAHLGVELPLEVVDLARLLLDDRLDVLALRLHELLQHLADTGEMEGEG